MDSKKRYKNRIIVSARTVCIDIDRVTTKSMLSLQTSEEHPEEYSPHSFGCGGCSFCFKAEVPTELIWLHRNWGSDAYKKYSAFNLEDKVRGLLGNY